MLKTLHEQAGLSTKDFPRRGEGPIELLGDVRDQSSIVQGMTTRDLRTPALLADLDLMESNLHRMATFFRDKPTKLRPHFKAHQVLALASEQLRLGANGISCARLEHAEALVQYGIENVLIANEIAGETALAHFVELSHQAPVIVAVDNPSVVCDMARLAGKRVHELNVVVDLDVRLGRCGVPPGERALALTKLVLEKGLRFRGLMGYEGHVPVPSGPEKQRVVHDALKKLVDTKNMLELEGIPVEVISCGGSSDYALAGTFPGVTEIQAGTYLLMDSWYAPFAPEFMPALTVLATVISKTPGERIVADAGSKAMSGENGLPSIKGFPELRVKALHVEHALIETLDTSVSLEVGDKIEIGVRYLDPTLNLHPHMYGVRQGKVEKVFTIER
jgi:D-serine deaminase-like pyridoxal phosphate-dependent protein